jgi:HPt (histidine-containing phosphotransfer) domain-containing protein
MDAALSKPIRPQDLLATIERLTSGVGHVDHDARDEANSASAKAGLADTQEVPAIATQNLPQGTNDVFDLHALLQRVENDLDLLGEMVELFRESSPALLAEIEGGIAQDDAARVERGAHALKGALQSMSAAAAARVAYELEESARQGNVRESRPTFDSLQREVEQLIEALKQETPRIHS